MSFIYSFNNQKVSINNNPDAEAGLLSRERISWTFNSSAWKNPRIASHEDEIRITSCSSFRRLQDKAQLYPLDTSDYTRTRLTHSLEVAALSADLATETYKKLLADPSANRTLGLKKDTDIEENFRTTIRNASLWHDIGNPPFGHFGEKTISDFFKEFLSHQLNEKKSLKDILSPIPETIPDLENFDGNAQSFRYAVKLQDNGSNKSLGLTYATIGATMKYPYSSSENQDGKFGFFLTEEDAMKQLEDRSVVKRGSTCNPLALIMDAGDDLANLLADIEDGFKKGKISETYMYKMLHDLCTNYECIYDEILKELKIDNYIKATINALSQFDIDAKIDLRNENKNIDKILYEHFNNESNLCYNIANLLKTFSTEVTYSKIDDNENTQKIKHVPRMLEPIYIIKDLEIIDKFGKEKAPINTNDDNEKEIIIRNLFIKIFKKLHWGLILLKNLYLTYLKVLNDKSNKQHTDNTIDTFIQENNYNFITIHTWLHYIRGYFISHMADNFLENYYKIMSGEYRGYYIDDNSGELREKQLSLIADCDLGYIYKLLKRFIKKFIYLDQEKVLSEIEGSEIIKYLLSTFSSAIINVKLLDNNYKKSVEWKYNELDRDSKITLLISKNFMDVYYNDFERLSQKYKTKKEKDALDLYLRLRLVADFVSGATDSHAKDLYSKLKGINLR